MGPRGLRQLAWHWFPVLFWMTLILALSSRSDLPARTNPATGEIIRTTYLAAKAAHIVEYSVLATLLMRAVTAQGGGLGMAPARAAVWVVLAATAFGIGDELRQSFVPNREARPADVAIDAASALGMVMVLMIWRHVREAQRVSQRVLD